MFKQLAALLFIGVAMVGGAFAQTPMVCQIDSNFTGAFVGQPGNYTIVVSPSASATLRANCSASVNSYDWSPGNAQTPAITVTAPGTPGNSAQFTLTGCNSDTQTCGNPVTITIQAATVSQSDCLFNWAETNLPSFFAPAGAISNRLGPYYYRYYSQSKAYLGISSADNHVYYLGPASNNTLFDAGALSGWLSIAGCR